MNKYSSGYSFLNISSVVGWVVIFGSLVLGIIGFISTYGEYKLYVVFLALGGMFLGFQAVGISAIGCAILDGSIAQQKILSRIDSIKLTQGQSQVENIKDSSSFDGGVSELQSEVSRVSLLAATGSISAALLEARKINNAEKRALALVEIVKVKFSDEDYSGAKTVSEEALSDARSITDAGERESVLAAINAEINKIFN